MRVVTRPIEALIDAARIAALEGDPVDGRRLRHHPMRRQKGLELTDRGESRGPAPTHDVLFLTQQRHPAVHIEHAREILRTLGVARHPVEVVGGTTQHASTQVSFVPPPCEEFTTNEPSRNATRVRPPGTMTMSRPESTNGRKST